MRYSILSKTQVEKIIIIGEKSQIVEILPLNRSVHSWREEKDINLMKQEKLTKLTQFLKFTGFISSPSHVYKISKQLLKKEIPQVAKLPGNHVETPRVQFL